MKPDSSEVQSAAVPTNGASYSENDALDQFLLREQLRGLLAQLRWMSNFPYSKKSERHFLEYSRRRNERATLACLADASMQETFVATVAGRGFNGKRRTVVLTNLRLFGSKFIQEEHLWSTYDKQWQRIEPFFQGQKVVLVGTVIQYTRKDSTRDYALDLQKVTKL